MSKCWKTGKREIIAFSEICKILEKVSLSDSHTIIVGSDSVKLGYNFIFTKAICVLNSEYYDSKYFYYRDKIKDDSYLDLSKRLLKETVDSIDLAMKIKDICYNANIEIHADVNPDAKHLSSKYKNMISGYIQGCGFNVKIKPNSFVASAIADHHTRKS
tara:strand:- start:577 stop:1053 length:477 start_codon:yes stop_codon:yes gene_type:complete